MSEGQDQRNRDFSKGMTDAQFAYIEAERRVAELKAENDKLREDLEFERSENGWAREFLNRMGPKCGTNDCPSLVAYVNKLEDENAKLREKLDTAEHNRKRNAREYMRMCHENDKLRELVRIAIKYCDSGTCDGCPIMGEDESCPYPDMARELGVVE